MVKLLKTGKTFKYVIAFPLLVLPVLLLREHIFSKFQAYHHETDLAEFVRIVLFFVLAILYSKNKLETVLLFFPIFISVFLFGGDRINFLGYFIFLYYGLQFRRGWNFGVLVTSGYFAYATIDFCINILGIVV
jgi:thiol:disulfide interchange protein